MPHLFCSALRRHVLVVVAPRIREEALVVPRRLALGPVANLVDQRARHVAFVLVREVRVRLHLFQRGVADDRRAPSPRARAASRSPRCRTASSSGPAAQTRRDARWSRPWSRRCRRCRRSWSASRRRPSTAHPPCAADTTLKPTPAPTRPASTRRPKPRCTVTAPSACPGTISTGAITLRPFTVDLHRVVLVAPRPSMVAKLISAALSQLRFVICLGSSCSQPTLA